MSRFDPSRKAHSRAQARRRICVITSTRADYGLLYWLIREIHADPDLELQLAVTGMHLAPEFGSTVSRIEEDGFPISRRVEILLASDTPVGIGKSMGLATSGFAEAFAELRPDIAVVLGDRFEIFAAAAAAVVARVPLAHIHGGEATEGLIDEAFRHGLTKMSHLHFTSAEPYRRRVIQLGEQPDRVFKVGAMGIDNILRLKLFGRAELEERLGIRLGKRSLLVTFHPVTLEKSASARQFQALLTALGELRDTSIVFTMPNADTEGRALFPLVESFVAADRRRRAAFTSMGQALYLSAMAAVDAVVGNSSSGLLEAPSLKVATLNIGDRQRGRLKAQSVLDCGPTLKEIRRGLAVVGSPAFRAKVRQTVSPYGDGGAAEKIKAVLKSADLDGILKKRFFDFRAEEER